MNNQLRAGLTAEEQLLLRMAGPYVVVADDDGTLLVSPTAVGPETLRGLGPLIERLLNTASGHA